MKRLLMLSLALTMLLMPVCGLAAGQVSVTQEAFYVTPFLDYHQANLFCEVTNTTNKVMEISSGIYEFYGADEVSIDSGSLYTFLPKVLLPGEKGYIKISETIDEAKEASYIQDYTVSIVAKSADEETVRYEVSDIGMGEIGDYLKSMGFYATVTNNSEKVTQDIMIVFAAYNAEGKLLFCDYSSSYGLGLYPGSKAYMSRTIDSDLLDALKNANESIATVEAFAYEQ